MLICRRSTPILSVLVLSLLLTLATISPAAQGSTELPQRIDEFISPYVSSKNFNGSILVVHNSQIVFNRGYGLANYELGTPITPETRFYIASISKTFTAAGILLLQEKGSLNVNDPVSRFIPDYPSGNKITIHQLLIHTSGLPRIVFFPEFMELSKQHYTARQAVALFKDKPLIAQPGERSSYSNANYVLLAYIIELVSGLNYGEFLKTNFFDSLGMSDTGDHADSEVITMATGYEPVGIDGLEASRYFDYSIFVGAGSLYSTTLDLHKWITGIYSGAVLKPGSAEQMLTKHTGNRGYGWIITEEMGQKVIGLDGWSNTGFTSSLTYYPDEDLTIVILNNINIRGVRSEIARGISAIFFGQAHSPLSFSAEPVKEELAIKIVGTYQFGADFYAPRSEIKIVEQDGHLFANEDTAGELVALLRTSESEFIHRSSWGRIKFQPDKSGDIKEIQFDGQFRATKLHLPR